MAKPMAPVALPGLPTLLLADPKPEAAPAPAAVPPPAAPREVQFLEMPSFEMPSGDDLGLSPSASQRELDESQRAAAKRLAERSEHKPTRHRNTRAPRAFVAVGSALATFGPLLSLLVAVLRGIEVDGITAGFSATLLVGVAAHALGWMWWAWAAAANAQSVRRGTISAVTAPLAYGSLMIPLAVAMFVGSPAGGWLAGVWLLGVHLTVNSKFAGASSRLGGTARFFSRLSWSTIVVGLVLALVSSVFARFDGSSIAVVVVVLVLGVVPVVFIKFEQDAMGHFDRFCQGGPQISASSDETLEAFLKRNQISTTSVTGGS
jgi:hypothetical protein